MSAQTIARWNAIPLDRPEKRSRSPSEERSDGGGSGYDDDVSMIARSPSPASPGTSNLNEYDRYASGVEREIVTLETKIKSTNIGHMLLAKMGWKEGQGLGPSGQGRPDPIPFSVKRDATGLGKANQDMKMIESTVSQRRDLTSEKQIKETEEQRRIREEKVAQRAATQSEVLSTLKPFYCELCDKQYTNVAQYDEHLRSYAHNHKQRFKEMQESQKPKDTEKRKEKERKREEKELRKMAAAMGVKIPSVAGVTPSATPASEASPAPSATVASAPAPEAKGFKKGGWASVSSSSTTATPAPPRWATVPSDAPPTPPSTTAPPPPPEPAPPPPVGHHTPFFRSSGWTNLDSQSTQGPPASGGWQSVSRSEPPPPPAEPSRSGGSRWAPVPPPPPTEPSYNRPPLPSQEPLPPREPPPPPPYDRSQYSRSNDIRGRPPNSRSPSPGRRHGPPSRGPPYNNDDDRDRRRDGYRDNRGNYDSRRGGGRY